jgi:ribosomal-protein-alanine N-acetyltransferase
MRNKSGLPLLIFHRDASRLAGGVTLSNMRFGAANSATIGYWIGARFAKQGLATAAVAGLIDHAFERIGLNRIEAACQPGNAASQRVLEKCGFRREGFARDDLKINGHWRDHAIYAVTASDHRQRISEP